MFLLQNTCLKEGIVAKTAACIVLSIIKNKTLLFSNQPMENRQLKNKHARI